MIVFVVFSSMIILCNKEVDALFRTRIRIFKRLCFLSSQQIYNRNYGKYSTHSGCWFILQPNVYILPISSLYIRTHTIEYVYINIYVGDAT